MQKNRSILILAAALFGLASLVGFLFKNRTNLPQVEPNGTTYYYTGPVLNKSGTAYADAAGNIVPTPLGAPPPPNASKKMPPSGGESRH